MTDEQAKDAFNKRCKVDYNGITYVFITALIYRRTKSGKKLQLELLDKCGHSVVIADVERVEINAGR